jgi:hypothetical protein
MDSMSSAETGAGSDPGAEITRELVAGGLEIRAYRHETISTAAARFTKRGRITLAVLAQSQTHFIPSRFLSGSIA